MVYNDEIIDLNETIAKNNYYFDRLSLNDASLILDLENVEYLLDTVEFKMATAELNHLMVKYDSNNQHLLFLSANLFDKMSEHEQSNLKLKQCIKIYEKLLTVANDSNLLFLAGFRLLNRLDFIGKISQIIKVFLFCLILNLSLN